MIKYYWGIMLIVFILIAWNYVQSERINDLEDRVEVLEEILWIE